MNELPHLVNDLALILVVAGIVTIVFKKLKQPLVLGYVVAGFLVSPHMPYIMSVVDRANIRMWGDIGVMFLLFSLANVKLYDHIIVTSGGGYSYRLDGRLSAIEEYTKKKFNA